MEESIKRKERLNAMRMEASGDGVGDGGRNSSIVSQSLANPLIEANSPSSIGSEQHAAPRFDYYTDPLAAFSANKRGSKVSHQISPDFTNHPSPANPGLISPTAQQSNYTPDLRHFQAQGPYYRPAPFRSPAQQPNSTPDLIHFQAQGPYYSPAPFSSPAQQSNSTPYLRPFQAQGPYYSPGPFRSPGPMGTPNPYNMPRGSINHWGRPGGLSPNIFPNAGPGFGQGSRPSFNHGQGRGYRFDNSHQAGSGLRGSPHHNSGRGRSSSGNPSSKLSGSRNAAVTAETKHKYYKESMVEDPWEGLKPVLWKQSTFCSSSTNLDGSNSWLPKSLGSKKPRVSVTPDKNTSGQSLAEYLAASFNEATNETDDNNDGLDV